MSPVIYDELSSGSCWSLNPEFVSLMTSSRTSRASFKSVRNQAPDLRLFLTCD